MTYSKTAFGNSAARWSMKTRTDGRRPCLYGLRPQKRPRGSARFRARHRSVAPRARLRCILHHEVQRRGDGAVDCRSSTPMGAGCGQRRTNLTVPFF